jgi:hypothetical protein
MSHSVQPADRAISTSPDGTWLDGLRMSFEPGSKERRTPESSSKQPNVFAGRLRSV